MENTENKRRNPGVVIILIVLTLVLLLDGFVLVRTMVVRQAFDKDETFPDVTYTPRRPERFLEVLRERGYSFAIAAVPTGGLTFAAPFDFEIPGTLIDPAIPIPAGAQITCDFASWSRDRYSGRYLTLEVEGTQYHTAYPMKTVRKLYISALERNGLEPVFQAETGSKLNRNSARRALLAVDRQLYENGAYIPNDYPFNHLAWQNAALLATLLSPFLVLLVGVIYALAQFFLDRVQYSRWLAQYNQEHGEHWNGIESQLPQFTSYAQSGIRGPGPYSKPGFLDVVKSMFKPMGKK